MATVMAKAASKVQRVGRAEMISTRGICGLCGTHRPEGHRAEDQAGLRTCRGTS